MLKYVNANSLSCQRAHFIYKITHLPDFYWRLLLVAFLLQSSPLYTWQLGPCPCGQTSHLLEVWLATVLHLPSSLSEHPLKHNRENRVTERKAYWFLSFMFCQILIKLVMERLITFNQGSTCTHNTLYYKLDDNYKWPWQYTHLGPSKLILYKQELNKSIFYW